MPRRPLLLLLVPLLLGLGACGEDKAPPETGPDSTAPADGQQAFPPARTRVPDGYSEALCPDLRARPSGLAIRLVVPDDYRVEISKYRDGCRLVADLDRDFSVSMNSRETLRHFKEKDVDPNVGYEGDEGTGDIGFDANADVFGRRHGELLTWGSNNDGLPLDNLLMQADGVRLAWHTPKGRSARWHEELEAVAGSIAVVKSGRDTCTGGGRTVTYTVPRPQTDDIDDDANSCYLYLRPRNSLLRYAEVEPRPRRSVEELAAQLPERQHVESVRLERGAATLLGEPADRLSWVVVRPHRTWDGPKGTWRIVTIARDDLHVTWGAQPSEWRREQADFEAFVASVRLSPGRPSR